MVNDLNTSEKQEKFLKSIFTVLYYKNIVINDLEADRKDFIEEVAKELGFYSLDEAYNYYTKGLK